MMKTRTKRTKYIAAITKQELQQYWSIQVPMPWNNSLFVQCTKEGKVNNWNTALVYDPKEIENKEEFKIVPFYKSKTCIHGCGQQFDVIQRNLKKGDIVYTLYNRIPGVVMCEALEPEGNKVGLVVKRILTIEKDDAAELKLIELTDNLLFTADTKNCFRDLETLFDRIQEEYLATN